MSVVGDWLRADWWREGDRVFMRDDPRHFGVVVKITRPASVKVKWDDNGFCSYIPFGEGLVKVRTLVCGCTTDGVVVCHEHKEKVSWKKR